MNKTYSKILGCIFMLGVGALYGGFGWIIAWILDVVFSIDVNYKIFVLIAIGIYVLMLIPTIMFFAHFSKRVSRIENDWDMDFK